MLLRNSLKLFSVSRCITSRLASRSYGISEEDIEKIKQYKERVELENSDALRKTYKMLKDEFSRYAKGDFSPPKSKISKYSEYVVIGGGIMGSSIAYSLKQRAPDSFEVMVVERDPKYTRSSTVLSVGGIRQQFSLPENIQLSMYSAEFLRNIKQHLSVLDDDPPDIQFQPHGYLFLATEDGAEQMLKNYNVQKELGAKVELLQPYQLKEKFPWMSTEGIALGSYGFENEGWFDPWALLNAFKKKACSLGAEYVNGEVIGFEFRNEHPIVDPTLDPLLRTNYMYIKDDEGEVHCVEFAFLIIAGGPFSSEVAKLLHIGTGPGMLSVPLPVEPRKRYVYVFNCETGPGIDMPLVIDPSGVYVRREGLGGKYICGRSPSETEEPDVSNLEVDYNFFDSSVWPVIAKRIPHFECIKVSSAWAGYYDYNTFDQNAIVGRHPYFPNVYLATGFSGHGIQMAPAVGRAMMELLIDKTYVTIDLTKFHFHRVFQDQPVYEQHIV
ncbi:FAD-dependent oxidoreductase domain-containing protein 1 isoform X2 [Parasteatoda tepidariorum]|uniref:FAD-dependent oxidoreductase domain-containing protein 1 isoform X2 n=1 Tax=Parasteatoda tepidariorum TaxID=114398 RepID=UPI00077FA9E2|nr:FAD-dependent oxidoreductase domain-containing protein 1 isoform X2 [Parasteatoda tepidariorum]